MSTIARPRPQPMNCTTFKAWRLRDAVAVPLDMAGDTLTDALASACASCGHKDTLFVLVDAPDGKVLHAYVIQQGKREYRGITLGYVAPLKAAPLFALPVSAFDPVEPWCWQPADTAISEQLGGIL